MKHPVVSLVINKMSKKKHTKVNSSNKATNIKPVTDEVEASAKDVQTEEAIHSEASENTADATPTSNAKQTEESTPAPEATEAADEKSTDTAAAATPKNPKFPYIKIIRYLCLISFIVFTALFINESVIQPYRIKKSADRARELYNKPSEAPTATASPASPAPTAAVAALPTPAVTATPTPDPNRDDQNRLLQFKDLLDANEDVKGWLTIPDTNIDYVVMQTGADDPDYYLDKDFNKEKSKAGTLYLDYRASVKEDSRNMVIYGHNMVSTTEKMFHYLLNYKKLSYYKKHPLINFDTIYSTGQWKIFAVFITPPDPDNKDFFEFRRFKFKDSSDFLNFAYQLRIRSVLNIDAVDINEDDQLLMLSTCSYEVGDNYRTVIVARKVRDGEDTSVDVENVSVNETPLYAGDYYKRYGGKAPELADTFEEALADGDINWYTPTEEDQ